MKNSWWNRRWRLHKCVAWVKLKYNAYKNSWTIHSQSLLKHFALQTLRMWNFYHFKRTIFPYGTYECSQALHMDMNTNTHKFSNGWPFFTNRVHYTHTFPCGPFSVCRFFVRLGSFHHPARKLISFSAILYAKPSLTLSLFPGENVCISQITFAREMFVFSESRRFIALRIPWASGYTCIMESARVFIDDCVFAAFKVEINKFN